MQALVSLVLFFLSMMFALAFILDWDERARAAAQAAAKTQAQAPAKTQAQAPATAPAPAPAPHVDVVKMIKAEQEKLERVQEMVYQLLGGLFNPETQSKTRNVMMKSLFNMPQDAEETTINEDTYPTTRQGDQLNDRCDLFFATLKTEGNRIALLTAQLHNQYDTIERMSESLDVLEKKVREQDKKIAEQQKQIDELFEFEN